MKRNELRKSLHKIKKELNSASKDTILTEASMQSDEKALFCTCEDAQGHPKMLYSSKKEAEDKTREHAIKTSGEFVRRMDWFFHATKLSELHVVESEAKPRGFVSNGSAIKG